MTPRFVKGHAYGNDFLLVEEDQLPEECDRVALARAMCERHRGVGTDGLIVYSPDGNAIRMSLLNADGSYSEVSGNGVRCLAAWLSIKAGDAPGATVDVQTDAGMKRLEEP